MTRRATRILLREGLNQNLIFFVQKLSRRRAKQIGATQMCRVRGRGPNRRAIFVIFS